MILLVSLSILIVGWVANHLGWVFLCSAYFFPIGYLFIQSCGLVAWYKTTINKDPRSIVTRLLISIVVKLLLSATVLILLAWIYPDARVGLTITFLSFFMVYSLLEIALFQRARVRHKLWRKDFI